MNDPPFLPFLRPPRRLSTPSSIFMAALMLIAAGFLPRPLPAAGRIDAFGLDSGALLFRGEVRETRRDGAITVRTVYARTDGDVLQTIDLEYDPDRLKVIRYRLVDPRSGETETITGSEARVVLAYKPGAGADEETETLDWEPALTCTELIAARIQRHLDALARGETLVMRLLVPSRLGTVEFRAMREGETAVAGTPAVVIRAEPAFWLFRMMVNPLRFIFAAAPPHRLLEYRGRSSVKTDGGGPIGVRLVYHASGG